MEQRAPGHTALDGKIYHKGFRDFIHDIDQSMQDLDYLNDPCVYHKQEQLQAMRISAEALIHYAGRYVQLAQDMAKSEVDLERRQELERIAAVCIRVPEHAPRDLWEALQHYWFVHLGVTKELNTWDAFSPGRFDQHLYPFFENGLKEGSLTHQQAEELLQCL